MTFWAPHLTHLLNGMWNIWTRESTLCADFMQFKKRKIKYCYFQTAIALPVTGASKQRWIPWWKSIVDSTCMTIIYNTYLRPTYQKATTSVRLWRTQLTTRPSSPTGLNWELKADPGRQVKFPEEIIVTWRHNIVVLFWSSKQVILLFRGGAGSGEKPTKDAKEVSRWLSG